MDPLAEWATGRSLPDFERITRRYTEASEFYDSKCFYLDEQSRSELRGAIYTTRILLEENWEHLRDDAFRQLAKAQKAIETGIGMKHIEEPKRSNRKMSLEEDKT